MPQRSWMTFSTDSEGRPYSHSIVAGGFDEMS